MTEKLAVAYLSSVKSSPLKVMRVTKSVAGLSVSDALKLLQFSKLKIASVVRALVYSAMSNAENNHNMDVDKLYVKEVDPNGLAADIRPNEIFTGEVVTRINRMPVATLADFQRVVESLKPGDAIVLNLAHFDRLSNRVVQRIVQFTYQ